MNCVHVWLGVTHACASGQSRRMTIDHMLPLYTLCRLEGQGMYETRKMELLGPKPKFHLVQWHGIIPVVKARCRVRPV